MKSGKHVTVYDIYEFDSFFFDIFKLFLMPGVIKLVLKGYLLGEDAEDGRTSKNVNFNIALKDLEAINRFETEVAVDSQSIPFIIRLIEALIAYLKYCDKFDCVRILDSRIQLSLRNALCLATFINDKVLIKRLLTMYKKKRVQLEVYDSLYESSQTFPLVISRSLFDADHFLYSILRNQKFYIFLKKDKALFKIIYPLFLENLKLAKNQLFLISVSANLLKTAFFHNQGGEFSNLLSLSLKEQCNEDQFIDFLHQKSIKDKEFLDLLFKGEGIFNQEILDHKRYQKIQPTVKFLSQLIHPYRALILKQLADLFKISHYSTLAMIILDYWTENSEILSLYLHDQTKKLLIDLQKKLIDHDYDLELFGGRNIDQKGYECSMFSVNKLKKISETSYLALQELNSALKFSGLFNLRAVERVKQFFNKAPTNNKNSSFYLVIFKKISIKAAQISDHYDKLQKTGC